MGGGFGSVGFHRLHGLISGEGFGDVTVMGQLVHDALFLPLLPRFVEVGGVHLPVGGQRVPVKDVHKFSDDMGLPVVNEVLMNGYQVNRSLRSVQGFNRPIYEDMVPRE